MKLKHECSQCPARDRGNGKRWQYLRRMIWSWAKARIRGKPWMLPCWPRKIEAWKAANERKQSLYSPPSVAPGAQSTVKAALPPPPLRSGPAGDSGQPSALHPPLQ